jgi:hypothetical protein
MNIDYLIGTALAINVYTYTCMQIEKSPFSINNLHKGYSHNRIIAFMHVSVSWMALL